MLEGSSDLYPLSFHFRIRAFGTDASRVGSLQRVIRKDADTSDMATLTVPWISLVILVVTNWFLCTDDVNHDTSVTLDLCWSLSNNLSSTPACVINLHHLYQFPHFLVAVDLDNPFVESMALRATISMR